MRFVFHLGGALAGLLAFGCVSRGVFVEADVYSKAHSEKQPVIEVIQPRDFVSIRVFGEQNLSSDNLEVRPNGTVVLPLLGETKVAGLTAQQLALGLKKSLEPYLKEPNVTVLLVPAPIVIHVMGEIGGTGRKEFKSSVKLPEVIAESGGLSQFADKSGIYVLRGAERIRFKYRDVIRGLLPARDFVMHDGDFVVVE